MKTIVQTQSESNWDQVIIFTNLLKK